jgi:hypothetical protein
MKHLLLNIAIKKNSRVKINVLVYMFAKTFVVNLKIVAQCSVTKIFTVWAPAVKQNAASFTIVELQGFDVAKTTKTFVTEHLVDLKNS